MADENEPITVNVKSSKAKGAPKKDEVKHVITTSSNPLQRDEQTEPKTVDKKAKIPVAHTAKVIEPPQNDSADESPSPKTPTSPEVEGIKIIKEAPVETEAADQPAVESVAELQSDAEPASTAKEATLTAEVSDADTVEENQPHESNEPNTQNEASEPPKDTDTPEAQAPAQPTPAGPTVADMSTYAPTADHKSRDFRITPSKLKRSPARRQDYAMGVITSAVVFVGVVSLVVVSLWFFMPGFSDTLTNILAF